MQYTLEEVKQSIPEGKKREDALWTKYVIRPLSYYGTVLLLNLKITPNTVSVAAVLDVLAGFILMCIDNRTCLIWGVILMNLFLYLDCLDGNMARTKKQSSYMGEFFDAVGALSLIATGVAAYYTTEILPQQYKYLLVLMGALGSVADIFSRLIYQKYMNNYFMAEFKRGQMVIKRENDVFYEKNVNRKSLTYIRLKIDRELGVGGSFEILMLVFAVIGLLDVFTILYSLYHIVGLFGVMVLYMVKAVTYEKNNKKQ